MGLACSVAGCGGCCFGTFGVVWGGLRGWVTCCWFA